MLQARTALEQPQPEETSSPSWSFTRNSPSAADLLRQQLAAAQRETTERTAAANLPLPGMRLSQPEGRDGLAVRQLQAELRNLRTEISQLSQSLRSPAGTSSAARGVLQQLNPLDADVRLARAREELQRDEREVEILSRRRNVQQDAVAVQIQRNTAARIAQRQRELTQALRRAERRLENLPPMAITGVRDVIIGEIFRARYSIAIFGGTQGAAQLTGLRFSQAV